MNVVATHPLTFSLLLLLKQTVFFVIGKLNSIPDPAVTTFCEYEPEIDGSQSPWQLLWLCFLPVYIHVPLFTKSMWVYPCV